MEYLKIEIYNDDIDADRVYDFECEYECLDSDKEGKYEKKLPSTGKNDNCKIDIDQLECFKNPTELYDTDTEQNGIKCGEIFTTDTECFNFLCSFCAMLFKDIKEFLSHFKTYHVNEHNIDELEESIEKPGIQIEPYYTDGIEEVSSLHSDSSCISETVSHLLLKDDRIENSAEEEYYAANLTNKNNRTCKKSTQPEFESVVITDCVGVPGVFEDTFDSSINQRIEQVEEKTEYRILEFSQESEQSKSQNVNQLKSEIKMRRNKIILYCDKCDKDFVSEKRLKNHMMYDHVPTNPFVNEEGVKINENLQIDPRTCRYCGKRFGTREQRYQHECIHTGERPFQCEICHNRYRQKTSLEKHLELHRNERKHKCDICGMGFNEKSALSQHIRRHTGDKRYKCSYCDKLFINSTTTKIHERTHTGEKPYQCTECGQGFTISSALLLHIRKHTGERPYKCECCDKAFKDKRSLNSHELIHNRDDRSFQCDVCDATFQRKGGLRQHKRIHSDVFGYVCKICGKGFKQYSGLNCHKRKHGIVSGNVKSDFKMLKQETSS